MFKTFHATTMQDLVTALAKKLGIRKDNVEYAKMKAFLLSRVNEKTGAINDTLRLIWKHKVITIEPTEKYEDGSFVCDGYIVSCLSDKDCLFEPYSVTGFDNLLYSLGEHFKLEPADSTMLEIKAYLQSLIPEGLTDLVGPCGLYIRNYPVYINAMAAYSSMLEMWATEYVVTCGDRKADMPVFNIT